MPHLRLVSVGGYVACGLFDWLLFMREGVLRPPRTLFQGQERLMATFKFILPFQSIVVGDNVPSKDIYFSRYVVVVGIRLLRINSL